MSANLKAPIVINNKTKIARQIVLQDNKLEVKYAMYADLKKYIVNFTSDDTRRTRVELASAVSGVATATTLDVPRVIKDIDQTF
jgi:flagellar assembly factor FliW